LSWRQGIIEGLLSLEQPTVIFSHFLVINTVVAYVREHQDTLQFWPDNGSIHEFGLDSHGNLRLVELGDEMATRIN
jgi:broad specificity phosphatase PhoE